MKRTHKPLLGLAVKSLKMHYGEVSTFQEMVDYCDSADEHLTRERFRQIESQALRKVRAYLIRNPKVRASLMDDLVFVREMFRTFPE